MYVKRRDKTRISIVFYFSRKGFLIIRPVCTLLFERKNRGFSSSSVEDGFDFLRDPLFVKGSCVRALEGSPYKAQVL